MQLTKCQPIANFVDGNMKQFQPEIIIGRRNDIGVVIAWITATDDTIDSPFNHKDIDDLVAHRLSVERLRFVIGQSRTNSELSEHY